MRERSRDEDRIDMDVSLEGSLGPSVEDPHVLLGHVNDEFKIV